MAAIGVLADWAALSVAGFEPSISRELNVVDAGFGSMHRRHADARRRSWCSAWRSSSKYSIASRQPDRLDGRRRARRRRCSPPPIRRRSCRRWRWSPAWPGDAVIVVCSIGGAGSWRRGSAGLASGLLTDGDGARSLEDPDLLRPSNFLVTIVVVIAAAGAWGVGRRLLQKSPALEPYRSA